MRRLVAVLAVVCTSAVALANPPPPRKSPLPSELTDFAAQVRVLFRVAACGSDDAIPARFAAKPIERHCKSMHALYASYQRAWADKAKAFIAALRPADLPKTVVYPFGGGDLASALVVYPDATEITTVSLEAAGDVRVVETISKHQLADDIGAIRGNVQRLYRSAHSTTKSLMHASHSVVPGTLMFALAALAVHEMEPVALRYFDIERDGTLRYLSSGELDKRVEAFASAKRAPRTKTSSKHYWLKQDSPFANVEIQFRPRGDARGPVRTYRHIVANLDDPHMTADDRVLDHLRAKGKVAVMTKAASFLLWHDDFSQIRDYLLQHTAWMISDASGLPPRHAAAAGFEQITYGEFTGPYFIKDKHDVRKQFVKLWASQPKRPLPFRFGYPDANNQHHLLITKPK